MGLVYRAKDLKTGEFVALKLVSEPQGTQALRFQQEALVLAEIATPQSCAIWPTARPPAASSTW